MPRFLFHLESPDGVLFPVDNSRCLIGRSVDCDVRIPSPEVSRRHAMILRENREWWLTDAGSSGGTWLNDARLTKAARIHAGDMIGIGITCLKFTPSEGVPSSAKPSGLMAETTRPGESEWLVTSDTAVLWATADGTVTGGSDEALAWMAAFFDRSTSTLPPAVCEWLEGGTSGRLPFECRVGEQRLRISIFATDDDRRLLVLRRLEPAFTASSLRLIGLSQAEANLVPWLIRGKRNDEIAMILEISSKTVEKQVASVLAKLGVETRTAAAWNIIERTGAHR